MYNKVFKNSQITYGVPFQVQLPLNLQKELEEEEQELEALAGEEEQECPETPEMLLEKAREEAALIIKEAEYEAARLLEDKAREAERKAADAAEDAWQKGYAEGLEAARKQCEDMLGEAEEARASAAEEHEKVLAGMEAEMVDLVLEVAKKVIASELVSNREYITNLAAQALESCSNRCGVKLKVSPEDYEYLNGNREKLLSMVEDSGDIEIKSDPSLKQGACIVETQFGNVDGGVRTKLQNIEEAFREALECR